MKMNEAIEVTIDYDTLSDALMEYASSSIEGVVDERIEHYMRYEMDISDMVSDYVNDSINDNIDSLLGEISPGSLCGLGSSFRDAIETILTHHIDMKDVLINNYAIETSGGISKLVQDAMKKEMVVNVTFVDKKPAEVITVTGDQVEGYVANIPGPVDEIMTRGDNV